jgi:hypothetical protein
MVITSQIWTFWFDIYHVYVMDFFVMYSLCSKIVVVLALGFYVHIYILRPCLGTKFLKTTIFKILQYILVMTISHFKIL